jgi:hypothetical protein
MPSLPKAGSIVSETVNAKIGTTELTLSNGVKVVLKPTDFNNDQVILGGCATAAGRCCRTAMSLPRTMPAASSARWAC